MHSFNKPDISTFIQNLSKLY